MSEDERRSLILMALGKASVEFMSQPQGGQIVMPTEALLEIAEDIHAVWALEVDYLTAEVRELREERNAAVNLSRCECGPEELCENLMRLHREIEKLREDLTWAVRRGLPRIRRDNPRSLVVGPSEGPLRWIEFDGTNESLLCAVREARTR